MRRQTTYLIAVLASACGHAAASVQEKTPPTPVAVAWQTEIKFDLLYHVAAGPGAVVVAGSESGLAAYAPGDGRPLWQAATRTRVPPVVTGTIVAVALDDAVEAFDLATGKAAWRAPLQSGPPPTLYGTDSLVLAVRNADVRAWRLNGTSAWQTTLPAPTSTRVIAGKDVLMVGLQTPAIAALDPATGAVKWTARLPAVPTGLTTAGDQLYVPGANGVLYAYRVAGKLHERWKHRAVRAIGDPLVDDKRVYYSLIDNTLKAFNRDGGTQRWSFPLESRPASGPSSIGVDVVVPLANGESADVPAATGVKAPTKPKTAAERGVVSVSAAAASPGAVYVIVAGGNETIRLIAWRSSR